MADVRPAASSLLEEISQFQAITAGKLGIRLTDPPADIVEKVRDHIDHIREHGLERDEDELAGLAVVLGEQYVRQFGWHWGEVNHRDDGQEEHYVASVLIADNPLANQPPKEISGEFHHPIFLHSAVM